MWEATILAPLLGCVYGGRQHRTEHVGQRRNNDGHRRRTFDAVHSQALLFELHNKSLGKVVVPVHRIATNKMQIDQ